MTWHEHLPQVLATAGSLLRAVTALAMLLVTLLAPTFSSAQTAEWAPEADDGKGKRLIIQQVSLEGNKRTRERIIRRELELATATNIKLEDTAAFFDYEAKKVFNTKLFNLVKLQTRRYRPSGDSTIPDTTDLLVQVHERWYFFPSPVLELADRSFNEWFYNRGGSYTRLNYGVRVNQYNTTGNNDVAAFTFQTGFAQSYSLSYSFPYLDKKLNTGMNAGFSYSTNTITALQTTDNKQDFDTATMNPGRTRFNAYASVTHRKGFFQNHQLTLAYTQNQIPAEFAAKNPDYFLDGRTFQNYTSLGYTYTYDYRNVRYYPTKGWYLMLDADVLGISPTDNYRQAAMTIAFSKFFDLGRNWYTAHRFEGMVSVPFRQSYFTSMGMRFGRYGVRGYELYLVEGPMLLINRNSLRKKLFTHVFDMSNAIKWRQFNKMPVEVFIKGYADWGYIYSQDVRPGNERLANTIIRGGGIGLDIATFYDLIFKMEYSFNQLGDRPRLFVGMTYDI